MANPNVQACLNIKKLSYYVLCMYVCMYEYNTVRVEKIRHTRNFRNGSDTELL